MRSILQVFKESGFPPGLRLPIRLDQVVEVITWKNHKEQHAISTTTQQPRFVNLRINPATAAVITGAIATANNQGAKISKKDPEFNFKTATASRDYSGLERAAMRIMKMRGQKYTDQNYQDAVAAIAAGKLTDSEQFRATIAFEGDATSIQVATRGIDQVQAEVPLFMLVEIGNPSVRFDANTDAGAWKKNERFTRLGSKLQIVATAAAPIIKTYLVN